MKTFAFISLILIIFSLIGCSSPKGKTEQVEGRELIHYSDKLSIQQLGAYQKITVNYSGKADDVFTYILYPEDEMKPEVAADLYVKTPIKDIIVFSTSHLPALNALNLESGLIGFPGTQWIYDSTISASVAKGEIEDIGQKNGINIEKALSLQPDLVMGYSMGNAYDNLKPLQQAGIPVVINVDYLETSPLGRAEWIKFMAAFFNKTDQADSIFNAIEKNYQNLKKVAETQTEQPSVLTGVMYGDSWYVPGGNSYGAKFIEDARGDYLWADTQESGSLEMSYETILNKAKNADYWIGAANFQSYQELKNTDSRYTYFDAFQKQNIYSYTKRMRAAGGNDYLESGYLRPDLVLQDHIKILHPELLQNEPFTYFKPLTE